MDSLPENVDRDAVSAQLERVLTSPSFESSPSLRRFLRYVVEETLAGRTSSLKEYSLGVMVFERGEAFDPRMDPIVRVQARNLRVRLAQYYAGPGSDDAIVIDLPKRTYVPVMQLRSIQAPLEPAATEGEQPASKPELAAPVPVLRLSRFNRLTWVGVAAALLMLIASGLLWNARRDGVSAAAFHDPDPAAQQLYIRGRYLMDLQTEAGLRQSVECFRQAVALDSRFAAAYAGIADAYNTLSQYGYMPPSEGMEQARRAAGQAIASDPRSAEGHVSLASILEAYDWNWRGAEREYRKAIELNPWLPAAHLWYGMFLRDQGRLQEALPELRRAAQLDPFSVLTNINLAHAYMQAGDYGAAAEQALHAAERSPQSTSASVILANAYRAQSRASEADAMLSRALATADDNPHSLSLLACAFYRSGKKDEGRQLNEKLEQLAQQRYVSPFDRATVALTLGDQQRALSLFEEAFRQRSSGLIFLRDLRFSRIRSIPQFNSLIEKMHFAG